MPKVHKLCCNEMHGHKPPECCAPDCWCLEEQTGCPRCKGTGRIAGPLGPQGTKCPKCSYDPFFPDAEAQHGVTKGKCEVSGCIEDSIKDRLLCVFHAYPAERKKSGRRLAIEWTKKKKALQEALKDSGKTNR